MKKVVAVMIMAMLVSFVSNQASAQKNDVEVAYFKSNMHCVSCQNSVTEYLKFEKGVKNLKVDFATNTIMVEYKKGKNSNEKLSKAIVKKGYKAEVITAKEYKAIIEKDSKKE